MTRITLKKVCVRTLFETNTTLAVVQRISLGLVSHFPSGLVSNLRSRCRGIVNSYDICIVAVYLCKVVHSKITNGQKS